MKPVTVFDFSGVYEKQDFHKKVPCSYINLRDLLGVHGFCDEEAIKAIEERSGEVTGGIRFIDSGNYHYVTYILMKNLSKPMSLVVLDHHTDMMAPGFSGLLSCGSWIRQAMDELDHLLEVVLIGVDDELAQTVPEEYKDRVTIYQESMLTDSGWLWDLEKRIKHPVYLSIDKDAFSPELAVTDWDQGSMNLFQLKSIWELIRKKTKVIAVDICGEYDNRPGDYGKASRSDEKNNQFNKSILELLAHW